MSDSCELLVIGSPVPKGWVSYCYHWSVLLAFCILINSSKTTGPIWTKLWWNGPWVVPFQNCVDSPALHSRWLPLLKIENSAINHLKIIFSETSGPIGPKLWWNGLQMILWELCPPPKIAAVTKNRKFAKKSLKNYLLWNY